MQTIRIELDIASYAYNADSMARLQEALLATVEDYVRQTARQVAIGRDEDHSMNPAQLYVSGVVLHNPTSPRA